MLRFRQLVINSIIATDIADKNQTANRNIRWNMAFPKNHHKHMEDTTTVDETVIYRKATIVIEHLIQASDVSHVMQHVRKKCFMILFLLFSNIFSE